MTTNPNETEWSYEGQVYRMTALAPLPGLHLIGRAVGILDLSSIAALITSADTPEEGKPPDAKKVEAALKRLEKVFADGSAMGLLETAAVEFAAQTTAVGVGKLEKTLFDIHFTGRLDALLVLVSHGVRLNYGPLVSRFLSETGMQAILSACGFSFPTSGSGSFGKSPRRST